MNRRGLLGSILAAPVAVVGALRKPSGVGRFLAGSVSFGKMGAAASEITFAQPILSGLGEMFSDLDTYEDALERARFDALADEYAAIQKGIIGKSQYLAGHSALWSGPVLDFRTRTMFPFDGAHGFPDVGEL